MTDNRRIEQVQQGAPGHVGAIDGLRAAAAIGVLVVHANYAAAASFMAWVDVLFVVSGYLTAAGLIRELDRRGSIAVGAYLQRRARRLLPALWVVVGTTVVGALALATIDRTARPLVGQTLREAVGAVLMIPHVVSPVGRDIAEGRPPTATPLIHLWSIGIEWWWYMTLPPAIVAAVTVARRVGLRRRTLIRMAMIGGLAVWIAVNTARAMGHLGPGLLWYQRPDALLLGVVVAAGLHGSGDGDRTRRIRHEESAGITAPPRIWIMVGTAGFGLMALALVSGTALGRLLGIHLPMNPVAPAQVADGWYWGRFGFGAVALGTAAFLAGAVRAPRSTIVRWCSGPRAARLGAHTYSLYLVHVPIGVLVLGTAERRGLTGAPALAALLVTLVGIPAATIWLHRHVENRLR